MNKTKCILFKLLFLLTFSKLSFSQDFCDKAQTEELIYQCYQNLINRNVKFPMGRFEMVAVCGHTTPGVANKVVRSAAAAALQGGLRAGAQVLSSNGCANTNGKLSEVTYARRATYLGMNTDNAFYVIDENNSTSHFLMRAVHNPSLNSRGNLPSVQLAPNASPINQWIDVGGGFVKDPRTGQIENRYSLGLD